MLRACGVGGTFTAEGISLHGAAVNLLKTMDYASTDIRAAMSRISQLLDSDASSTHSDAPISDREPAHTPSPVRHKYPSVSGVKNYESFNEDILEVHRDLSKTMSSKQFQSTTLSRMGRYVIKTKEKLEKMQHEREARDVQENQAVPKISEKSKKMATAKGSIYERTQKYAEESKKEIESKKTKALEAKLASENSELTFKPKTKALKTQGKRDAEEVNKALYNWQKEKESKVKQKQELKVKGELDSAPFKPALSQRTNKLASRRYKEKQRVDKRLYEGTKHHLEVLKRSEAKYGPTFQPDLSETKGHRMKDSLDKDVFNRLYHKAGNLAEILRNHSSQTKTPSQTARVYQSSGSVTSTRALLEEVKPSLKLYSVSPRPQTERKARRPRKEDVAKHYRTDETPATDLISSIFGKAPVFSEDEAPQVIQEESEDEGNYLGDDLGSLLASLSSLTKT
jgi:hypothetical protein